MQEAWDGWKAFTSSHPEAWLSLARKKHRLTPFLAPAAQRLLEQLPDPSGLNRLESEILTAMNTGCSKLKPLFKSVSAMEDRPFFGDVVVWNILNQLAAASVPLVELHGPFPRIPVNVYPLPGDPGFNAEQWQVFLTEAGRLAIKAGGNSGCCLDGERWVANVKLTPGCGLSYDRIRRQLNSGRDD